MDNRIRAPRACLLAALAAATILSLAAASPAMAAPSFVQGTSASTSSTTLSHAYAASVTAGDLLVLETRTQAGTSVSDSLNGAWTQAVSNSVNSIWYKANSAAGADTITVSATSSGSIRLVAAEYAGVATTSALDGTNCTTGTGTTVSVGPAVSTSGDLAFAALGIGNTPITVMAGGGATLRDQFTNTTGTAADEDLVSSSTSQSMTFTLSAAPSLGTTACMATFHAAPVVDTTPPTVPSGLQATPGNGQVSLSWQPSNDNGGSDAVAGYDIYRNGVKVGSSTSTSYTDSGLTNGTSYSYTVDAYDQAGNVSAQSGAVNATPVVSPTFVQGVGTSTSGTTVSKAFPASVAAGDTLVGMFRTPAGTTVSDSLNGAWTQAYAAADGVNSLWYRSNSAAGADTVTVSATTSGSIRDEMAEYSDVGAFDSATCNTGTGTSASTGGLSAQAGELAYAGVGAFNNPITVTAGSGSTLRDQFTGSNGTSAEEDMLANGSANQTFSLSSSASWAACEGLFMPSGAADTIPPTVPTGLQGTPGDTKASLSWQASNDNGGGDAVTGYDVYRNGTKVGTASGTSFTDTGLTNGTTYSYTVDAFDAAGNVSAQSSAVNVTPASSGSVDWLGSFTPTCNSSTLYPYRSPDLGSSQIGSGGVLQCQSDPNGSSATVLQMTVSPNTCTYNCEQRMDWDSPHNIAAGADKYISIPIMVATNFPCRMGTSNGIGVMFNEQFGDPQSGVSQGSPTNDLNIQNNSNSAACMQFSFSGNTSGSSGGASVLWRGPLAADGAWHDFIEHMVFSTSASVGEVQIWEDGSPITFNTCSNSSTLTGCGTTTLHYPTLEPGTDGSSNWVQINNYRNDSPANYTTTLYHGAPALGSSFAAVQGTIVNPPYGP
jgi:chitodextrinase